MRSTLAAVLCLACLVPTGGAIAQQGGNAVLDMGSELQLLADRTLVDAVSDGAQLRLHSPTPREVALVADAPWEGNGSLYATVFRDGDLYRMYYRGARYIITEGRYESTGPLVYCYAESPDGIHWTKPNLGLHEFDGSRDNNIVHAGTCTESFAPFRDGNPQCALEARYKALANAGEQAGLYPYQSPDGIHWTPMSTAPVITDGAFDSQNVAFWDQTRGEYRAYFRDFRDGRDIKTCTSPDFLTWTEPVWLQYHPSRTSELYTNQILPYFRAPHLFLGFPTRYVDRGWTPAHEHLPRLEHRRIRASASPREGSAVTDGMFMASRDALSFQMWPESFIRPGLRTHSTWFYGDIYQSWGVVETASHIEDAPAELSVYASERYHQEQGVVFRRYTLRMDGFVSAWAPLSGGEVVTRPFTFAGGELLANLSTSAAGDARVEVQTADGEPVPGFSLDDCPAIFGDGLEVPVTWTGGKDLRSLAGTPVRLRFVLRDADLYAFVFR